MRILIYQHQFPAFGGIETVTTMLARQFSVDGHQVRIVSLQTRSGTRQLEALPPDTWHLLPSERIDAEENQTALRDELEEFKPDVILFQDSYAPIEDLLFVAVKESGCRARVIVCEHNSPLYWWYGQPTRPLTLRGVAFRLYKPVFYLREYLRQRRRRLNLLVHASRYVVLAQTYVAQIQRMVGRSKSSRVSVVYNPIPASDALNRKPLEQKEKVVLFVGSLIPRKGVRRVIDCWAKVEARHGDWRLEIVGDGPQRGELEKCVRDCGLRRVSFAGHQADTASYYRRASILAVASDFEGWPMVIGEAMQAGCVPVVYDSFAAAREMVQDGVSGLIVKHFSEKRYVEAIAGLMTDSRSLARMQQATMSASRQWVISEMAKVWYNMFANILSKH